MRRLVLLDAGPIGMAVLAKGVAPGDACRAWLDEVIASGHEVVILEVADYEVRELVRLRASAETRRLDGLQARFSCLPITTAAMARAADLWAILRRAGLPTTGPDELYADAILAGQAATMGEPGDVVTVATTNLRHLARFPGVDAKEWATIA